MFADARIVAEKIFWKFFDLFAIIRNRLGFSFRICADCIYRLLNQRSLIVPYSRGASEVGDASHARIFFVFFFLSRVTCRIKNI